MAWDRYVEKIINVAARGTDTLMRSLSSGASAKSDDVQTDEFPLRLRFVQPTGNAATPFEVLQLAAGSVIVYSGKESADLASGPLLYYLDTFVEGQDADGYYYDGVLTTNTVAVDTLFSNLASNKSTVAVTNEIEIQNAGNTQRTSFQHLGLLRRQVYAGEGDPTPAAPPYPLASDLVIKTIAGKYRFKADGSFQLWNVTQSKFHTLSITGAAGAEQLSIGAGED